MIIWSICIGGLLVSTIFGMKKTYFSIFEKMLELQLLYCTENFLIISH